MFGWVKVDIVNSQLKKKESDQFGKGNVTVLEVYGAHTNLRFKPGGVICLPGVP